MKTVKILLALFIVMSASYGCSKYEENDEVTLKTKKNRLCKEWYLLNEDEEIILEFRTDGALVVTSIFEGNPEIGEGVWSFESHKEHITMIFENSASNFEIQKLTSDEFWILEGNDLSKLIPYSVK